MLCHENRTAVLVRKDGGLISIDLLRDLHNLLLVKSDQRTVNRHRTYLIGCRERLHGLARHLSDTLSRNQSETLVLFCKMLRQLHHVAPHDNRQLLMRALLVNI